MAYTPKKKVTAAEKPQQEFAKGVSVKVQETKFGDIIKAGITGKLATLPEPIRLATRSHRAKQATGSRIALLVCCIDYQAVAINVEPNLC